MAEIGRVARLVRLRRGTRAMTLAVAGPPVPFWQRFDRFRRVKGSRPAPPGAVGGP